MNEFDSESFVFNAHNLEELETLGKGAYGKVTKFMDKNSNRIYACKERVFKD